LKFVQLNGKMTVLRPFINNQASLDIKRACNCRLLGVNQTLYKRSLRSYYYSFLLLLCCYLIFVISCSFMLREDKAKLKIKLHI